MDKLNCDDDDDIFRKEEAAGLIPLNNQNEKEGKDIKHVDCGEDDDGDVALNNFTNGDGDHSNIDEQCN